MSETTHQEADSRNCSNCRNGCKGGKTSDGQSGQASTRGRFIIDPDGVTQAFEVLAPSVGRNVAEAIRQIKAFQLVRESKGTEAIPSGWKPGKPTLKPSPELVGNVWKEWKVSQAFED